MDNDRVVVAGIFLQPGNEMRRIAIAQPGNFCPPGKITRIADAHRVERQSRRLGPCIERRIEGQNLLMAAMFRQYTGRGRDDFNRAAGFGID
jgi:hypothetical protein